MTFCSNVQAFLLELILFVGLKSVAVVSLVKVGSLKLNRTIEFLRILYLRFLPTLKGTSGIFENARRNVIEPLVSLSFFELLEGRCFDLGVNSFETGLVVALI